MSPATDESRPENTSFGAVPGLAPSTTLSAISEGRRLASRQAAASRNFFPSDRSLAPRNFTSNHGWSARSAMNCWPTMPVAPRMPTGIRAMCVPLFSKKKADTDKPCRQVSARTEYQASGRAQFLRHGRPAFDRSAFECRREQTFLWYPVGDGLQTLPQSGQYSMKGILSKKLRR